MIFCVMRDEFWQKLILEILLCCGFLSVVTSCQMSKTLNLQFHGIFCIIWRHVKILSKCFDEKALCPVIWWTIGKEKPDFVYREIFKQVFTERENHPPPYPHIHTHNQKTLIKAGYNHNWPYQKHYQKKYSSQKSAKSILPHNKLHKLFNKSNIKIRYSCLSNIKSITNA